MTLPFANTCWLEETSVAEYGAPVTVRMNCPPPMGPRPPKPIRPPGGAPGGCANAAETARIPSTIDLCIQFLPCGSSAPVLAGTPPLYVIPNDGLEVPQFDRLSRALGHFPKGGVKRLAGEKETIFHAFPRFSTPAMTDCSRRVESTGSCGFFSVNVQSICRVRWVS